MTVQPLTRPAWTLASDLTASAEGRPASPRSLFVPVDWSAASERAVARAIRLARVRMAQIMLVGLVPTPEAVEASMIETARALLMLTELGFGPATLLPPDDAEARVTHLLHEVIAPLQARIQAAGISVSVRLLHGTAPEAELRRLLALTAADSTLVVSPPRALERSLGELTEGLLADPPCPILVAE